ncbi:MAG TPA: ATP-binding protein, partial [Porticoccaceae bacterium]
MLEHITVKGFRSLRDFQLDIKPGLNVLVGPNGAGKTNIILFFEFFRRFANSPLADAVGKAGGVSKIFAKRGKNGFSEKLRGALSGRVEIDGSKYIYTYSFEIEFSLQRQDVYFSSQELLIERHRPTSTGQVLPYFHARCNTQAEPEERLELISIPRGKEGDWMRREAMHMSQRGLLAQHCMTSFVFRSDEVVAAVANDFAGRFVLNVVPGHVKRPEDSTRQPGIESDGSGLTATLFAIKKRRPLYDRYLLPRFRKVPTPPAPKWETVLDLIRVAVPSITDIDVENDPFDNRLRCHITVGT